MRTLLTALMSAYCRWRYVEDTERADRPSPAPRNQEPSRDEGTRLRAAIARERRNLESYLRFQCAALAGPCRDSIHALEGRLRALEMMGRRAV